MVCFGCTGGRHRSVCAAEEMFRRMQGKYNAAVVHRDAQLEKQDIQERGL
jgi:RNase adaptor protein for sRNA GlmZ degradation